MIKMGNGLQDFFLIHTNQLTQLYEKMILQTFLSDYFLIVECHFLISFCFNFCLVDLCKNSELFW